MDSYKITTKSAMRTFSKLDELLSKEKKLYFIRFGDGEIYAMQQINHRNYKASEGLAKELKESFIIDDPNYLIGLVINCPKERKTSRGAFEQFPQNKELISYLINDKLVNQTKEYESAVCFHIAAVFYTKAANSFFEKHIRPKKKMFIGGSGKEVAEKLYGSIDYYVQVPRKNAYDTINEWWPLVMENIDKTELVIPSAGAASNVICKRLWELNKEIQLLDIGSVIDAVEGNMSRKWIRLLGHRINNLLTEEHRNKSISFKILSALKNIKYFFRRLILKKPHVNN